MPVLGTNKKRNLQKYVGSSSFFPLSIVLKQVSFAVELAVVGSLDGIDGFVEQGNLVALDAALQEVGNLFWLNGFALFGDIKQLGDGAENNVGSGNADAVFDEVETADRILHFCGIHFVASYVYDIVHASL